VGMLKEMPLALEPNVMPVDGSALSVELDVVSSSVGWVPNVISDEKVEGTVCEGCTVESLEPNCTEAAGEEAFSLSS